MHRSAACARRLASLLEACSTSYSSAAPAPASAASSGLRAAAGAAAGATGGPLPPTIAAAARRAAAARPPPLLSAASSSSLHTSCAPRDLREFLDEEATPGQDAPTYGRAWKAAELRLKSWDDLHRLWYVSLKERNLLETRMLWLGTADPVRAAEREEFSKRRKEVKLTMNRIKQVLAERARQELHPRRAAEMRRVIHLM